MALIFVNVLVLAALIIDLIGPIIHKLFIGELAVCDLAAVWVIGYIALCQGKIIYVHYAVTSTHMIFASWGNSGITKTKIAWYRIKSIKVREESCDVMTITIKPYFWSGHNIYDFRCIAEGNEVLALITAHRPDLYSDQWFS